MQIDRLDHLVLTVADIARTCEFYTRVLEMEVVRFGEAAPRFVLVDRRSICIRPTTFQASSPTSRPPGRRICASSPRRRSPK